MSKNLINLEDDLADLGAETATLRELIKLYELDAATSNVTRELLSKSGLASSITKLYTGCEKIMEYLTKDVDNAPIGHSDGGWHATLLKRVAEPYQNVRTAIISRPLFDELDRLRGFRHRERTSYGRTLDGSIVAERAQEMADAAEKFRKEVEEFIILHSGSKQNDT